MSKSFVGVWAAVWERVAPRGKLPGSTLRVGAFASDAPMRAMMAWGADWKTATVAAILNHRQGTLIDVGANVGQTLLDFLAAPRRSAYLGFEPNLTCYQHLAAFISANRLSQCRVVPVALGDRNGIGELYRLGGDTDAGATMRDTLRPRGDVLADPCCLFRLDDLGELLGETEIALIKIDTEGTELEVLRGAEQTIRRTRPWILCEVLHRDELADPESYSQRCDELMRLVSGFDYRVQRIVQSATGSSVAGLEQVDQFPNQAWDEESIRSCDYIFVPASDVEASREVLTS